MKKIMTALLASATLLLNGCEAVRNDLHRPGGVFGRAADRHMFDASSSKQLQVLRATIVLAMVARAGTVYAHDGAESDAFANALVSAADEVNSLAGHLAEDRDAWKNGAPPPDACIIPPASRKSAQPKSTTKVDKDQTRAEQAAQQADAAADRAQASADASESWAEAAERSKIDAAASAKQSATAAREAAKEAVAEALAKADPAAVAAADAPDAYKQKRCQAFAVNFESDMPLMERALFRVTVQALPQDLAKNFIKSLQGTNLLVAVWDGARLALAAIDGLHNAAAVNRTALEIEGHQSYKCGSSSLATVKDAFGCLGLSDDYAFVAAPAPDYAPRVDPRALDALMLNIEQSCLMLPLNTDQFKNDAKATLSDVRAKREAVCHKIGFAPKRRFTF